MNQNDHIGDANKMVPAAAQEADMALIPAESLSEIARELERRIGVAQSLSDHEEHLMTLIVDAYERVEAAPVAAAPVECREQAIKVARESALAHSAQHSYLPQSRGDAENWQPHEWVITAIQAASLASTPAAPGIDLAILRELADDWSSEAGSSNGSERDALRSCAKELRGALDLLPDASPKGGDAPVNGEVLVTVSGFTGSGKSAVAGEIEILCKALGLEVEWVDSEEEKRLTHADWTSDLELYKPRVRIVERNIPRPPMRATSAEVGS